MVKKVLVALLSATMVIGLLAGCGSSAAEAPAEEEAVEEAAEEETEEAEAPEEAEPEAEAEAEAEPEAEEEAVEEPAAGGDFSDLMVGAIVGVTIDDGGFCQANFDGLKDAMTALGMDPDSQLRYAELVAADPVSTESAAEEMMDEGCSILFFISTSYAAITEELAPKYPDVLFCQTGVPQENVLTYHYRAYESPYALGYLCALMNEGKNEFGYIGGMSEASVREGANGFALGAKAANPDATVNLLWVDSWYDPAKEGENANTLIASGINYIGTGTSSSGAPQACAEKGAFCTCFDMDHTDFAPDAVLASMVFDWAPIYKSIFEDYAANGMQPFVDNYFYGAAEGCSKIAFNDALVPEDIQAQVQEVLDKIGTGEIQIYGGELKDNEGNVLVADGEVMDDLDILNQNFLVENVIGSM